jgi:hypothetical protein
MLDNVCKWSPMPTNAHQCWQWPTDAWQWPIHADNGLPMSANDH